MKYYMTTYKYGQFDAPQELQIEARRRYAKLQMKSGNFNVIRIKIKMCGKSYSILRLCCIKPNI
jgi:hypothetical protein